MDFEQDTILKERYRIQRLLGKGGMGAVYLALDLSLESQVAIKINHGSGEQSEKQFLREAHLLASMRHTGLPRVIDYFVLNGNQFLVMDYIPGKDLSQVQEEEGALPLDRVLTWAQQLGSALSYLHSQNPPVTHRDIKPANIKLTEKGEVMLVDFGIAKAAEATQATTTGALAYTAGYAPPEQYGTGRTGPFTDQYAFAATIYHLISGQKPVDSVERVLGQATLKPLLELVPEIPVYISAAIDRALSIRPGDRYLSVKEFVCALTNPDFKASEPVHQVADDFVTQQFQAPLDSASGARVTALTADESFHREGFPPWVIWALGGLVIVVIALLGIGGAGIWFLNRPPVIGTPTEDKLVSAQKVQQTNIIGSQTPPTPTVTQTSQPTLTLTPSLTSTFTPTVTSSPTITPTLRPVGGGGAVAFVSDRADGGNLQIWTMRVGSDFRGLYAADNFTQLTFDNRDKQQPAWSPDGNYLLYVAPSINVANGLDIWKLDYSHLADLPVNLTNSRGDDLSPAWSPDGSRIAYVHKSETSEVLKLYSMNPDGDEQQMMSDMLDSFSEYEPCWSPGMENLMFATDAQGQVSLMLRSQSGNFSRRQPFNLQLDQAGGLYAFEVPSWSPKGDKIVFTLVENNRRFLYIADYKTQEARKLLMDAQNETDSSWSPDGQLILFTSEREKGNPEIYITNASGVIMNNLTNQASRDLQPAWQP